MKYFFVGFFLISILGNAQELTPTGITATTTKVDFGKSEIFEKLKSYTEDYLVNDQVKITHIQQGESISLHGDAKHVACYINQKMGAKHCFNLSYDIMVTAQDKQYLFEVTNLQATNESAHPEMNYMHWFDANGQVIQKFGSCVEHTSNYFEAINLDFKEYIEEGEFW